MFRRFGHSELMDLINRNILKRERDQWVNTIVQQAIYELKRREAGNNYYIR